jgi:hypothetical protein
MNGNPPDFDPQLADLFSEANEAPLEDTAFISHVLADIRRERRRRLLGRVSGIVMALTAGAFAAPFVGGRTFAAVDWLGQNISPGGAALASPVAGAVAALITWRIARRVFNH